MFNFFALGILCQLWLVSGKHFSFQTADHSSNKDFQRNNRIPHPEKDHLVVFAAQQRNLDALENILYEVSDPLSPKYGQFRTASEIADLTSNHVATDKLIAYLQSNGAVIREQTLFGDYVVAIAPIRTWENMFKNAFSTFSSINDEVLRADHLSLHEDIYDTVSGIFHVTDLPLTILRSQNNVKASSEAEAASTTITPSVLTSYYNIFYYPDYDITSTLDVYMSNGQYFSSTDLANFQSTYGLPAQTVASDAFTRNNNAKCVNNVNDCAEGQLDVEYAMATGRGAITSVT